MRYTTNFKLALYDLHDKWSNETWNNNYSILDEVLTVIKSKTDNLNQDTATFTTSVTAPSFIGNADTASKLKTARSIKIGNKALSFDGSENLVFTLDDMSIAAKEHTHSYLPLDGTNSMQNPIKFSDPGYNRFSGITGIVGDSDAWRIGGGASATNSGYIEISSADDGREPIYIRQYSLNNSSQFGTVINQATLLDENGYTTFPKKITVPSIVATLTGNVIGNADSATRVNWRGRITANTGNDWSELPYDGLSVSGIYHNGFPVEYGNLLSICTSGKGDSQLALGWSGVSGAHADNYIRNRRDVADAGWSDWAKILTDVNYSNHAIPLSYRIYAPTGVTHTNYPNNGDYVPTMNFMSYWNGAYNITGNSNLQYCDRGRFGSIVTKNVGDYASPNHTHPQYLDMNTNRTKGTVLAGPGTQNGNPSFRKLVETDLPPHTHSNYLDINKSVSKKQVLIAPLNNGGKPAFRALDTDDLPTTIKLREINIPNRGTASTDAANIWFDTYKISSGTSYRYEMRITPENANIVLGAPGANDRYGWIKTLYVEEIRMKKPKDTSEFFGDGYGIYTSSLHSNNYRDNPADPPLPTDGTICINSDFISPSPGLISIGTSTYYFGDMYASRLHAIKSIIAPNSNDYAEYFERGEDTEVGDIIALDEESEKESYKKAVRGDLVVGVHSDTYGSIMGGNKSGKTEDNDKDFIPVGMVGRVYCKVIGKVNKRDMIFASDIPGVGKAGLLLFDKDKFSFVGYALEDYNDNKVGKIRILLK